MADARDPVPGPIDARLIEVVDADTIRVRARIWPHQHVETLVRLAGVDAPELKAACGAERELALRARRLTEAILGWPEEGATVFLQDVRFDKFGGRVLARVITPAGEDLGEQLLSEGLAQPYRGGRRKNWCQSGTQEPGASAHALRNDGWTPAFKISP